jgi:hypothetical protein
VAVEIQSEAGTQTILSNLESTDELQAEGLRFRGETAMLQHVGGQLQSVTAINARELMTPQFALRARTLHQGRVRQVDYNANTITLDRQIARADMLVGRVIILNSGLHRTSYEIAGVSETGGMTTLHFGDIPMIVGVGNVAEVDARDGTVSTSTQFGRFCVNGADYRGRRLLNHDRSEAAYIEAFDLTTFNVRGRLGNAFDPDGDTRRRFWIGDVGVNDQWAIPAVITMQRDAAGKWMIESNIAAQLTLDGQSIEIMPGIMGFE